MIVSMTGFVTKTVTYESLTFTIVLKSVNGRFFEANCKLPFALTHLETDCIKLLKSILLRGTVYLTITVMGFAEETAAITPALSTVAGYLDALRTIQQRYNLSGNITINDIVNLPNIFETSHELIDEQTSALILDTIKQAAEQLNTLRAQEGTQLAVDIQQRIALLKHLSTELTQRAHVLSEERRKALSEQSAALLNLHPSEFKEQQLAVLQAQLDRYDVHEEIVRFSSHLSTLSDILTSSEVEKGKRIDFTLQELMREVNTMASKSNDATMSSMAITCKVELEKIREQAQNIV